ncbi:MAG: efflux RND transporter periplasmic adaptor subunit [Planctomycetota bacterium]|nr:efflux RND transporter periplasmic adaptor subunit [Planctomycetota bacterium]
MMRTLPSILLALTVLACTGGEPKSEEAPREDEPKPGSTNRTALPATVRANLGITFVTVERRAVERTRRLAGAFELEPLARREYRLPLAGTVELAVAQYAPVKEGDLLFRYRSPEWPELQHEILQGEQTIDASKAEIEVVRTKIVETETQLATLEARLQSLAEFEIRRADLEQDRAEIAASLPRLQAELALAKTKLAGGERTREHALHRAAAAAGLNEEDLVHEVEQPGGARPAYALIQWLEVRAEDKGVVELLAVTDGSFHEAPTLVLTVVDPTRVRFRARGLQADLSDLAGIAAARVVPPSGDGYGPGEGLAVTLALGLEANPTTRLLDLIATPTEAAPWARMGIAAFLEVVLAGESAPALAVPRAAVVRDGLTHVLFRRDPKNPDEVIRVEADLGADDGRWVVLQSGVLAGDEVVLEGAYELRLATQQSGSSQKAGHFHSDGTFHGED